MQIHLLAGPPFGPGLYDDVIARLRQYGLMVKTIDPFEECQSIDDMIGWIQDKVAPTDALVAHGTAVPLAAVATEKKGVAALFLSNGPIGKLDPTLNILSKTPYTVRKAALRPIWAVPAFRSSAGLRRLVVNPYVMDHDTIVRVCKPLIESKSHRKNYARYLGEIDRITPVSQPNSKQIRLIWGDSDLLYPTYQVSTVLSEWENTISIEIEGAKHLHPIESPWAIADIIKNETTKA